MKMKVFKNIFKIDNIQGNTQEYCHKDKNIHEKVMKGYSKDFLDDENIVKTYLELNEIKRMLEINSAQNKNKHKRNPNEMQSMDSAMNTNYNVASPTVRLNKANSNSSGFDTIPNLSVNVIPDLVITPMQPPVHQLTEKYKQKKIFSILNIDNLDFEVTIYFPKKFEALRKFY